MLAPTLWRQGNHEVSLVQNKFKTNINWTVRPCTNQGPKVLDQEKKRLKSVLTVHDQLSVVEVERWHLVQSYCVWATCVPVETPTQILSIRLGLVILIVLSCCLSVQCVAFKKCSEIIDSDFHVSSDTWYWLVHRNILTCYFSIFLEDTVFLYSPDLLQKPLIFFPQSQKYMNVTTPSVNRNLVQKVLLFHNTMQIINLLVKD